MARNAPLTLETEDDGQLMPCVPDRSVWREPMPRRRNGVLMKIVITMMAGLLLLAGCAPAQNAPSTSAGRTDAAPVSGGRLVVGAIADAKVLNPVLSSDVPSAEVWSRVYESLIKVDPQTGAPTPSLAE